MAWGADRVATLLCGTCRDWLHEDVPLSFPTCIAHDVANKTLWVADGRGDRAFNDAHFNNSFPFS
eukprot:2439890-Amphidinium_carterae.1